MADEALLRLAQRVGERLRESGQMLSVAESCTGGWIAKVLTDVVGSSDWFDRGFVTYSNAAKMQMLGVDAALLETHGAVSEATVRAMAEGALARSGAALSVAVSGIAGPGGGSADKPVGTVWLAWAGLRAGTCAQQLQLAGDREAVRRQAVARALQGVLDGLG